VIYRIITDDFVAAVLTDDTGRIHTAPPVLAWGKGLMMRQFGERLRERYKNFTITNLTLQSTNDYVSDFIKCVEKEQALLDSVERGWHELHSGKTMPESAEDTLRFNILNPVSHEKISMPLLGREERIELATVVSMVFSAWNLTKKEQAAILGVSRSSVKRYSKGYPLSKRPELLLKAAHVCAIYELLHVSDIDRPDRADKWPTTPSKMFNGARPVDLMCSLEALEYIRLWLED
jgi:hypothetical protein